MRLAQFIVTPETRSALSAIRRIAHAVRSGRAPPEVLPLFLHGAPGVGKSHLVSGLLSAATESAPPRTARLVPAADLGAGWAENELSEMVRGCLECDLLIIEDLQHLPERAAGVFSRIVDQRLARSRALVVTAGVGPAQLRDLPPRMSSRLSGGLVVGLNLPSPATRRYLLERFAQRRRLAAAAGVLEWLAAQAMGGVRPLLGAITTLAAISAGSAQPLDLKTVQRRWPDLTPARPAASVERIVQRVAWFYAIEAKELDDRKRHARTLWPLQVAMFLVRQQTGLPWARIGDALGGRDASTVRHAVRKVAERVETDPATASALRQLSAEMA